MSDAGNLCPSIPLIDRWLILVSFERESALMVPFWGLCNGRTLFLAFNVEKSVFDQFKEIYLFSCYYY